IGWPSMCFGGQQNPYVELGKIEIPKDLEFGIKILPKGEFQLGLFKRRQPSLVLATIKPDAGGLTYALDADTEVTDIKENYAQPKIDVGLVTEAGEDFVRVRVFMENKVYQGLWKCATEAIDPSQRAKEEGPLDPAVETEVKLLKEAHALLDRFAGRIWPGWDGYKTLDFTLRFPNRDTVIVTQNQRLPVRFKILPGQVISAKAVYIDRTKELPGRISSSMSVGAHGDISGVTANLISSLKTEASKTEAKPVPTDTVAESLDREMRLTRMMIYIHEPFHSLQAQLMLEASKAGLMKPRGDSNRDFDASLEYSVYADLEGKALLRAYQEKDKGKALQYFKESSVVRELKHKAMPPGAAGAEERTTQAEGTATYANLTMAKLIKETGYVKEVPKDDRILSEAYATIDDYLEKEGMPRLEAVAGETLNVTQKPYLYGAFQCFLLDRLFPQWKNGFFEKDRSLDEVITEFIRLSAEEKARIAAKLKSSSTFKEVWAKHSRDIKDRDDTVQLVTGRKGTKYVIDLKRAQRGFEINPRNEKQVILYQGAQFFPHGLVKLVYGSLNLESVDTPMRLSYSPSALEWVDTETKPGEKGYELKYDSKAEDLYQNVTLKTRGFTMTAKAVKIVEDAGTVTISIID
ncbi:MAG TPA: hypothetical protein VEG35_07435, partial [Burkholderiales bacterium]|nr:hypothetical protein [Burkholderiales bacterium]